jgi:general secretion pathway protein I
VKSAKHSGFTLLEVIVALAIVGMALGSVFSLSAGSKRLAFKASENVGQIIFLRAAVNIAQILEEPEYPESPKHYRKELTLEVKEVIEPPKRQTQKILLGLEPYTYRDEKKGIQLESIRWKELSVPQ